MTVRTPITFATALRGLCIAVAVLGGATGGASAAESAAGAQTTKQALVAGAASGRDDAPALPGRPLASGIGDPAPVVELQRRIDALQADPQAGCADAYRAHKAQAWLNFSRYAYHTGVPQMTQDRVLAQAATLVDALETHAEESLSTAELPGARHLRDDLWRGVDEVKADGRICSAPKMTAFCEVELVWAGYEASVGGWRHVDPYVRIAEDYCAEARAAKRPLPPPAPAEVPAIEAAPIPIPVLERFELSASVLFPHDRATRADMRSEGRAELQRLAAYIGELLELTSVTVIGHADVTGTAAHNLALSKRRAASVAAELQAQGVDSSKIVVVGVGSTEPVASCDPALKHAHRSRYLSCLEPDRRVTIELAGTKLP